MQGIFPKPSQFGGAQAWTKVPQGSRLESNKLIAGLYIEIYGFMFKKMLFACMQGSERLDCVFVCACCLDGQFCTQFLHAMFNIPNELQFLLKISCWKS